MIRNILNKIDSLFIILIGLIVSPGVINAQESNLEQILYNFHSKPDKILVAAHRSAHLDYPENSIASFHKAIRLGVDIIETDVRATKDGVLVIMHDKTVDRTTNGTGNVADLTFEEIRTLRLLHNGKVTDERVPTFEELLTITKDKIMLDVDFKADTKFAKVTCEAIIKAKMEKQVLFFLYDYKQIPEIQQIASSIQIMPRAYSAEDIHNIRLLDKNIPVIHIDKSFYDESLIKQLPKSTRIWANALNEYDKYENKKEGFEHMLQDMKYVNIIQTDYPEQLISVLKEKELKKLEGITAKLLEAEMIYQKASFPSCHASTIVETKEGLLAAWFGGTHENNPDVCIYTSKKSENGKWTNPVLVADGIQSKTLRYPCWNPVLFRTDNGDIVLYYKVGPSPSTWWGEYKISKDEGRTWSGKTEIPRACLGPIKNKPVRLSTGKILYPTSIEIVGKWNVYMETSNQDISGWEKIEIDNNGFDAIQPSVLNYEDGSLQILCRSKNKNLVESWSRDNGKTWSKIAATSLPNNNSGTDAVTLSNGLQLLIYNPITKGRNQLAIAVSKDGKNWKKLLDLENQSSGEFSYPAIIEGKDGLIHATYTYNRELIKYVKLQINDLYK